MSASRLGYFCNWFSHVRMIDVWVRLWCLWPDKTVFLLSFESTTTYHHQFLEEDRGWLVPSFFFSSYLPDLSLQWHHTLVSPCGWCTSCFFHQLLHRIRYSLNRLPSNRTSSGVEYSYKSAIYLLFIYHYIDIYMKMLGVIFNHLIFTRQIHDNFSILQEKDASKINQISIKS